MLHNPFSLPFFGAKLDLALGAKYNLEGAKVQGFKGKFLSLTLTAVKSNKFGVVGLFHALFGTVNNCSKFIATDCKAIVLVSIMSRFFLSIFVSNPPKSTMDSPLLGMAGNVGTVVASGYVGIFTKALSNFFDGKRITLNVIVNAIFQHQ